MNCSVPVLLVVTTIGSHAQTPVRFEVASIKPAKPFVQALTDGSLIGMKTTAGRISIGQADINKLIQYAYNVKKYQVVGPDWFQDLEARFDVEGKFPEGATTDQVPFMLQSLLAERFLLKVHKGSVETDTYALIVGAKGTKFLKKQSTGSTDDPPTTESAITVTVGRGGASPTISLGGVSSTDGANGMRVVAATVGALTTDLSRRLRIPVVDKTNLSGEFEITMEIPHLDIGVVSEDRLATMDAAVFAAVERIGLKLVRQKNPVETIVVESVNGNPTEN